MKNILKYALFFAFVAIALFVISEASDNASAADVTWARTGGNVLASLAGNWQNGSAPTTGDNVYFTSTSVLACTWDITATVNYIGIYSGYTGATAIVTQGSNDINVGARGIFKAAGVLTGVAGDIYWVNCAGNYIVTGGTQTGNTIRLNMSGSSILSGAYANLNWFKVLKVTGSLTLNGDPNFYALVVSGTMTISTGVSVTGYFETSVLKYSNTGTINGAGTLIVLTIAGGTWNPGTITSKITFSLDSSAVASRTISLINNLANSELITVSSGHATYTITLNPGGYSISSTSMTIGVRGILSGSGAVSCSSNFDSYNGTTSGSWSLTMTGINPWIKSPAANTINGLTWTGTNLRLASSLNVTKTFWVGGTYTLGTKTLTVGTATNVTITLGNSWTVPSTCYWGSLNVSGTLTAASSVSVWANSTCSVNGTVNANVVLHVKQMTTFNGAVGNLYIEAAYRTHFYANGTWTAIYWNTTTTWNFHPEGLMPYTSPVYSKAQMRVLDPTNNAYYIEVSRFDTNVGFSIMVHGWAAETWEFTVTSTSATATLFTYNIVTPDVETEPVLIYLNGVYLDSKNMTLGSFSMNDVFNSTMGTRDYLIVCSDFGPTTPTTTFDYGIMGMCLVILSILTFASFRFQPLFIINGFVWITVAMLIIEPVQATIALLCLGVGLIFAMWGAYRALLG